MAWRIRNINFKSKGGSTTTVQSYKPTEYETRLQKQAAEYSEAIAPNALWLNNVARSLLQDSLGTVQVDYNSLLQNANSQISNAQNGVSQLTQGVLPTAYQQNMENSISSAVNNTVGNTISSLGSRGVLNSSVTNTALNDISKNVSDTMAEQYSNNISTLNGLYGQQASLAGTGISTSAAAQEAAQQPAFNLWNASLGLNGSSTSALSAMAGQGTQTTTQTNSGGSAWGSILGGALNMGASVISCFAEETPIKTSNGDVKAIRKVQVGDKVMAYDHVSDTDSVEEVTDTMAPRYDEVYIVVCQDDNGTIRNVSTTLTQPFMCKDGTWKEVSFLRIGDELKNVGKVKGIAYSGERKVYDLKVTGANTYYANGFVSKGATNEW